MPDYLEAAVDKFIFRVATDRLYSPEGVWALAEGDRIRVGMTDFLQQRSGDVAFAEVRSAGRAVATGDEVALIETIKANVEVISPVSGAIAEVNPALATTPEAINQDPYGAGLAGGHRRLRLADGSRRAARPAGLLRADEGPGRRGSAEAVSPEERKVMVVPCSGIGKTYGTVSREAAYEVTEDSRPGSTELVALSLLVLGDEERARRGQGPSGGDDRRVQARLRRQDGAGERRARRPGHRGARRVPEEPGAEAAGHRRAERGRASCSPTPSPQEIAVVVDDLLAARRARRMPELPKSEGGDRRLLRRGAGGGDGDPPGRAQGARAAAPRRDGDHLPAALPGRRRRRPGVRPLLSNDRRRWLRHAGVRRAPPSSSPASPPRASS